MKILLQNILRYLAQSILKKYKPEIIAVTGSVGKTSAKEAIYTVLHKNFQVRRNLKSYNTEIGVPCTIIGSAAPGKSLIGWMMIVAKGLRLIMWHTGYPKILILEMALDHPRDIEYLTNLAPPSIGVITMIGSDQPVHVEFFRNVEELIAEKMKVLTKVKPDSFALLNRDDPRIWERRQQVRARIMSFGFSEEADIYAWDIRIATTLATHDAVGLNCKISHQGATVPVFLPGALGEHQIYAALIAIAVGRIHDMNLVTLTERLRDLKPLPGRMRLLSGIKLTHIIDDTYNSSPVACQAALRVLGTVATTGKKFAILGDMSELGKETESAHEMIGRYVLAQKIDFLITCGEKARIIANSAQAAGMSRDRIFEFPDAEQAKKFVQERIEQGDVILVKGSRIMCMERIVKEIMAEPLRAKELLVEQDKE
ncbi:MAG: hypothetical protein A3B74_01230 [Candidatus Kerfeldbacteria bacterium RIFCSPHIGHO2_02_FULL_42_14]|uniref:UDP-N-acetylmuramoyl-tripeptide--D-alanyl-D-alanine ligase n=1 Tax=Candidatus Kerfeldbacteria bacterium RIFCSPHIGHO2_02_FULL_42_14 TaxID=1798540 RepID=A0A1G2AN81_9BACT|nr:MAG: hypothetical protein A3B74_01230 [Candidatus Kerfeldbacteria bacterium RIFCSPHIGHO2_02_FULL_42_14]OGY81127.1 MAG: hypothetical protein A3E60_04695 [Candidatus Kerfeldbacteria bacterium RIFCSPHIGHO2_12_FULL_42_13]OGY84207.1 MAG: hypothetical protein A3I91_05420 [Candidatus Kerfeldbacteria bacterium RIFCSPLOWO2_02_FULL_42_19]OGY87482.1 MAG: hypothetical protein A3G01_02410 [Candidatus Kerfeldbacteria bacterium RIFCSPLOWO2_12_FULL_43_9]